MRETGCREQTHNKTEVRLPGGAVCQRYRHGGRDGKEREGPVGGERQGAAGRGCPALGYNIVIDISLLLPTAGCREVRQMQRG